MDGERGRARNRYLPIGDYAVIGDCHTAALVSRDGSVDWYCPARFDAPAVFCKLLDAEKGGYLGLAPAGEFSATRCYRGPTNVLETTFDADGGRVRLTDCMPVRQRGVGRRGDDVVAANRLLRLLEGVAGEVEVELRFKPTFDYARATGDLQILPGGGALARAGGKHLALACHGFELSPDGGGGLRARRRLRQGERCWVALTDTDDAQSARVGLDPRVCEDQLAETIAYWERWAGTCTYRGPYRPEVLRSALVLKLLTFEPTGALVAAPTTSLPEEIGGERNWDYRFSWLRDSALILYALMTVGYGDEAADFFEWLESVAGPDEGVPPQIMYGIDGRRDLAEATLGHLDGYRSSRPVRIGNAAASQHQLDIYGEVLSAAYLYYGPSASMRGGSRSPADERSRPTEMRWALLQAFVERAAKRWQQPDQGIWEVRGGPQHFLYSKLMCWAALDRGIRLADDCGVPAPVDRWRRTRDEIRQAILERGFDAARGAFTQALGSTELDASALAISRVGFLPATDPRVKSTIDRIQTELTHNGLVYRYRTEDGLRGSEATFALCTFWLVDALALGGRQDEAQDLFERVVTYANDVGLIAEEIDSSTGALLGNFPQGFTHLALIGSAVNLAKAARHGAEDQPESEADRAERAHHAAAEGHPAHRRAAGV